MATSKKITISTIAQVTGLSKYSVSRSLADKSGVSEETRARVKSIAEDLGYIPAPERDIPRIGVIFHDTDYINSRFYLKLHQGIEREALSRGYRTTINWTHSAADIDRALKETSGLILVGPHEPSVFAAARALNKPVVRQGRVSSLEKADNVSGTDHEAGAAVAEYLLSLNHRRIVYVHGQPGYRGRVERSNGMREVLEPLPDVDFREMIFEPEADFADHFAALLKTGFKPTAFFCARDGLALTVVSELLRLGYKIPRDVSVVGFGNDEVAVQVVPQLTTVGMDGEQVGAACMRLLDDRLNMRISPNVSVRLHIANEIIFRGSCGHCPAA